MKDIAIFEIFIASYLSANFKYRALILYQSSTPV